MQEVDDLLQGFLGFILAGHILEGHTGLLFHIDLGFGFAEAAHHAFAAHTLAEHTGEQENTAEHQDIVQNGDQEGVIFHDFPFDRDTHGIQGITQSQGIAAGGQACVAGGLAAGGLGGLFLGHIDDPVVLQFHFLQIVLFHFAQKIGISGFGVLAVIHKVKNRNHSQQNGHADEDGGQ